jgi:amidophosphoribosyltransferase
MAKLGDLVAFQAAIALLRETHQENVIDDVYERCLANVGKPLPIPGDPYGKDGPAPWIENPVKAIYAPFTAQRISDKIAELLTPPEIRAEVRIVYQGIEGLRAACPQHAGDWYFTGDYPTPGGNRVVNRAFINWRQGKNVRAY